MMRYLLFHERRENNNVKQQPSLSDVTIPQAIAYVNEYDKEFTNCSQGVAPLPLDEHKRLWYYLAR